MRAKTIKAVLRKKIDKLADYVEQFTAPPTEKSPKYVVEMGGVYDDPTLAYDIRYGTIVTGGAIVSFLMQDDPNDYDFYFKDRDLAMRVAKFFLWLFKQQHYEECEMFIAYQCTPEEWDAACRSCGFTIEDGKADTEFGEGMPFALAGWLRHYPTAANAKETPGTDRFKIVIKSAGIASTQEADGEYKYFESRPDEEGQDWIESLTNADEITQGTLQCREAEKSKGTHHPKLMTANAISLAGDIQLITRFWGSSSEIHANYDFVHCTCSYDSESGELDLPAAALECILTKELRYIGSLYPLCSIIRIRKFVARGWRINAGQILKMIFQVSELNLNKIEVLEEQLTGVDAAYFIQIIERLRANQIEKRAELVESGKMTAEEARKHHCKIDGAYLATLIDRIF